MVRSYNVLILLLQIPYILLTSSSVPTSEMKALEKIAGELQMKGWDFNQDPCTGASWIDPTRPNESNVSCDCSVPGVAGCHVVAIVMKKMNLVGFLPSDLSGLPYLRTLDVSRNYLSGSIPPEWGSTNLVKISLLGNRLTGSIPKEIGNMSSLEEFVVEYNQLSGVLPPELGNLSSIHILLLTSNYFTGELPQTLGRLTTLVDLRIGDNTFSGRVPNFLQNFSKLQRLYIYGNNFSGPIPQSIELLMEMQDLRIADLIAGPDAQFPSLKNMKYLSRLILKNCNLAGNLPDYWDKLTSLQLLLDLSFNRLSGQLPRTFQTLANIQYMYLTGNMLNGKIPDYLLQTGKYFDLSYNNFSDTPTCLSYSTNLFASSSMNNVSKIVSCLQNKKCPSKKIQSVNINCGGPATKIKKVTYNDDTDFGSPSKFFDSNYYWAYSNTGNFMNSGNGVNNPLDVYTRTNNTPITTDNPLYTTARVSPLSLTYYAYCMRNGNYTVLLHFAEITFTNDTTYQSLGRRVFDIYIQGILAVKDFNIETEAGGVGIPIIRKFPASVESSTLEIRLYWAGKGTDGIPEKGVFGPLISAISISPNFSVSDGLSKLSIIAISVSATVASALLSALLWRYFCKNKHERKGSFNLRELETATRNFDPTNKIGEGGFGSVYKGVLPNGTTIAVKRLSSISNQGTREFLNEVGTISALNHPNLVKLYGCCVEEGQLLLVYEYMHNNSLARALHGEERLRIALDWPARLNICVGIARGLAYLHEESTVRVVHRDIKANNILLDKHLNPKISDFGVAKLTEDESTHVSTRVAGTPGYMAPEYALKGRLSSKADVYSFGVVLLEIVSGKSNATFQPEEDDCYDLLAWAVFLKEKGRIVELIDCSMGLEYNQDDVVRVADVALLCTNLSPAVRPVMSAVRRLLEEVSRLPSVDVSRTQSHWVSIDINDSQPTYPFTSVDTGTASFDSSDSCETAGLCASVKRSRISFRYFV